MNRTTSLDIDALATPAPVPAPTYGPISYFLSTAAESDGTAARGTTSARVGFRVRNDTYLLLAIAIAIPVLVMEAAGKGATSLGLLSPILFVGSQLWLATLRTTPSWLPTARLAMCLAFIGSANLWGGVTGTWPLSALAVPVVALAVWWSLRRLHSKVFGD